MRSANELAQEQLGMANGILLKRADDLEPVPLVEPRGLERVGVKCELVATMTPGLCLGRS